METIYYKTVKCSDGLPEKEGEYITDMGVLRLWQLHKEINE